MKKVSILIVTIGFLLVGCSQKEEIEASVSLEKDNSETKMERLELKETNEIAIFSTAVSDSTKVPGSVNMANPQYNFTLDEEMYFLWITEDNGAIMNRKDSHTIYSLSTSSTKEVNQFINKRFDFLE